MEIKPHKLIICGLQGSGKTYKARELIKNYKTLIISPHKHDFKDFENDKTKYYMYCDNGKDLETILEKVNKLLKTKKWYIDGILIDEADMFFSSNYDVKPNLNDFIINHRHKNVFLILITRRPQDIPSKIFESSKYIIIFSLQGANIQKKFNDMYKGLGDMILQLNYEKHEHILKEIGKSPIIYN